MKRTRILVLIAALATPAAILGLGCEEEAVCGNGQRESGEQCDGAALGGQTCANHGYTLGALGCGDDCTYDVSDCYDCGNGTAEGAETCDGSDLAGLTCLDLGYVGGDLACNSNCTADESGCCDFGGTDPCADETCSGHGTCVYEDCVPTCVCDAGYQTIGNTNCSESTCPTLAVVPDPWAITFMPYDISTGLDVSGALVEVYQSDGTLLDSGTSDGNGEVQLSIPTGGRPIDGYFVASMTGYLPTRFHIQGGLGNFTTWRSMLAPVADADDLVQTLWGVARDPNASIVRFASFECQQGSENFGIPGTTVTLSPAGTDPVYSGSDGSNQPSLSETTRYGAGVAANVPAGDNTITVALNGQQNTFQRTLVGGTLEVIIVYPRNGSEVPACGPGDVSDFVPEWKPSNGLAQGLCTDAQAAGLTAACFGSAGSNQACTAWKEDAANASCVACAYAQYDAPNWNAIVNFYTLGFHDRPTGQCVSAFEGDLTAASCGAKIDAAVACAHHACKNNCPIRADDFASDLAAFNNCHAAATNVLGVCGSYQAASNACTSGLLNQGDPVDDCLWGAGEDWVVMAERYVILMCGDGTVGP